VAESFRGYVKRLREDHRLRLMGNGSFGHVFQHPTLSNVVVKVYERNTYTQTVSWLRWCYRNQNNPYVPRIIKMGKLKNLKKATADVLSYHIVFMEKLEPLSRKNLRALLVTKNVDPAVLRFDRKDNRWYFAPSLLRREEDFRVKDKYLDAVLQKIFRLSMRSHTDVTERNCMMRGNQLVFTDPVE
jgi:hypothetical protein